MADSGGSPCASTGSPGMFFFSYKVLGSPLRPPVLGRYVDYMSFILTGPGGAIRWMSPELFDLSSDSPTRKSDCYALGVVIYEVLSGLPPFSRHGDFWVLARIMKGEHPERLQGGRFSDGIWEMLERCWEYRPTDRPSLDVVLRHLHDAAPQWSPPPDTEADEDGEGDSDWSMSDDQL